MEDSLEKLRRLDPSDSMEIALETVNTVIQGLDPLSEQADDILSLIKEKEEQARAYYLRPFDSDDIYNNLIEIHSSRNEQEMVDTYRRCLDLKQARKWMILGDSYQLMGINGKASSYLKRSLFFGPSEDLVEEVERTLEKAEKRVSKAKDEIDRMLYKVEKDPGHVKNISKTLSHLIDLDRFDEAIERADMAISEGSDDPDIRYRKGCALFGKGELDKALMIFDDLLEMNPTSNNYKRAVNLCRELHE